MTITLPDELKDELERKARAAGFATTSDYVCWLVQRAEVDDAPVDVPDPPSGARYVVRTREELEAKLIEGMDRTGDVVADADFWERRRRALEARSGGAPQ